MIDLTESRYDRQERIWWWDQSRLATACVLVVGAGALGNEIVKNLCLVGVGRVDVVDMDTIEHSNLARCALFRESDEGRPKAEVLVEAAAAINPDVTLRAFVTPVQALGSGTLADYDLVIAGLDNREARLWVNGVCRLLGRYWVDGAIEGLQGLVRVFGPEGPCYECTLGDADHQAIGHRRSCALLSPGEIASGRTPTNATSASVVAALEVQEAIKVIVGRTDLVALVGRVWRMEGETMLTSVIGYQDDPDCFAHDRMERLVGGPDRFATLAEAVDQVARREGVRASVVYLREDLLVIDPCSACGAGGRIIGLRPMLPPGSGRCAECDADRPVRSQTAVALDDPLSATPWDSWLWPRSELVALGTGDGSVHVALEGSR